MLRKFISLLLPGLLLAAAAGVLLLALARWGVEQYAQKRRFSLESVPPSSVAIVFGAGLSRDGTPSPILRDRIETAAKLLAAGKVQKILMSGDNRFIDYNEPGAMQTYALRLGVPPDVIVLDFAGRRTYDTCYRARSIFGVQKAILVTQDYHLPRALVTCNILGVQASGVPADIRHYRFSSRAYWYLREVPATAVALWDVWVARPLPVLGEPEPIFSQQQVDPKPAGPAF